MRKMKLLGVFFVVAFAVSCKTDGLTKTEVERIYSGDKNEIMTLFVIENKSDSLLLRQNARKIKRKNIKSETVLYLTSRMLATVNDPNDAGVGIAAPQVGVSARVVCVQRFDKENEPFEFYFNPVIESYGDSLAFGGEGCLSVPGVRGEVQRAQNITISYLDSLGNKNTEKINGFTSVIFQHEIDHLNGVLYFDRINGGYEALTKD